MTANSVNYDRCATDYEQRYSKQSYSKVRSALLSLAHKPGIQRLLEVGCGTGHWLRELQRASLSTLGVDPSIRMLKEARLRDPGAHVACARAEELPLADCIFDFVFCVNAFHHFEQPASFVSEARRVLRQGGRLAIIGLDPHESGTVWYLYKYFAGTYERDLKRYKPQREIARMLGDAGFADTTTRQVEHLSRTFANAEVLNDPFLRKDSTSQLSFLPDSDYVAGLQRIHDTIHEAKGKEGPTLFRIELSLSMVSGRVR